MNASQKRKDVEMSLHIELTVEQHAVLSDALADLRRRYEVEAASYASLGETGRKLAVERIQQAKDIDDVWKKILEV